MSKTTGTESNAGALVAAIHANSTLEDFHIVSVNGGNDGWAVDVLSALGSHSTVRKLSVAGLTAGATGGAIVNATGSVVRSTQSLQCLELAFRFDKALLRVILEALRSNQTVSSLKLASYFDKEATSDFAHFIRHECNRNGNLLRELVLEKPLPSMFGGARITNVPPKMSLGYVVASMLRGSALEALYFPGSVRFRDNNDSCGATHLFHGLLDPIVTLPSLQLATLDGPCVESLVSFLSATTCLRHLTIVRLEQMHGIRAIVSACRQNGSLHTMCVSHATDAVADAESRAEWASLHAWFVRHTTAFCNRNKELLLLLSGHVSLDDEASSTDTTTAEVVYLFPLLIRVAQHTPRMGANAVFAGLLTSKCDTIGPYHSRSKNASGTKRLLQ
jgi:hypothetical protein